MKRRGSEAPWINQTVSRGAPFHAVTAATTPAACSGDERSAEKASNFWSLESAAERISASADLSLSLLRAMMAMFAPFAESCFAAARPRP